MKFKFSGKSDEEERRPRGTEGCQMSDAIKTISLDDIGGLQGQGRDAPNSANVMYNPQYGGGDQFQTETSAPSDLDQPSDIQPLSSMATGSSFGTSITRMTEIFGRFDTGSNTRNYIIVGGLVLALAAALYLTSGDGTESPLSQILSQFGSSDDIPDSPADDFPETAPTMMAPTMQQVAPPQPKVETPPPSPVDLQNPYWALPNPLENTTGPELGLLTPGQEERWRQGLAHPFVWQRYKTVIDMRAARLKGSQYLLNDALAQPKFWTRMEALIALAESGEAVDIDTVETAIGSTRRSLIQNYFRRFRRQATGGEIYIMRQAIRITDAGTRRVILENLINRRDPTNDLYLVAATYDPNTKVSGWLNQELAGRPLSDAARQRFQQVAAGLETPADATPKPTPTATPASKVQDLKVEELSNDDVNVEEVYFLKDEDRQETKIVPMDDGFQDLEQNP
jgi:hypothetical protein